MRRLAIATVLLLAGSAPVLALPPLCDPLDDPCVVDHDVTIDDGELHLGDRELVIAHGVTITVRTRLALSAATVTLEPNARIQMATDGVLFLSAFGDLRLEPGSVIDAPTVYGRSGIELSSSTGNLWMRGALRASGTSRDGVGGQVVIEGTDVEIAGDGVDVSGGDRFGAAGFVVVHGRRSVTVLRPIGARGSDGGIIDLEALGDIVVASPVVLDVTGGNGGGGGQVFVFAGGAATIDGDVLASATGEESAGGDADLDALRIALGGRIDVSGEGFDGIAGSVTLLASDTIRSTGPIVARAHATTGSGGTVDVIADGDASIDGPIEVGPAEGGSTFSIEARSVRVAAPITVGGADSFVRVDACTIDVALAGSVVLDDPLGGTEQRFLARRAMTVAGTLRSVLPVVLEYRDTPPVITASAVVEPDPQIRQNPALAPCEVRCGDGVVDTGESCDDGNESDGDCCSAACAPAAAGAACSDERRCTTGDACDGAGACVAAPIACGPCVHCDESTGGCVARPKPRCARMLAPGAGMFDVKAASGAFLWRWRRGAATPLAAFGDPASSTDYDLCFYTPSDAIGRLGAAHGPAWTALGARGFRFLDQSAPDGTTRLKLLAGESGRSSIELKGRAGASRLPIETPLVVQLQSSDGACWTSQFSTPSANLPHRFKARSD